MRIGTAEADSTFLTQGQALAAVLARRGVPGPWEVLLSPQASIDNANRLHAGEIDLGFMAANWIGRARLGEAPFAHPIDIRMVAPMNAGPLFFIARADSTLKTFDDLAGKRVSVGPSGSGMAQHARTMFAALSRDIAGIEVVNLSFADGADALADGRIDAQLQCPIPNKVMTDIDQRIALRVLQFTPAQLDTMLARVSFYRRTIMRKGMLRALTDDVAQPGVVNVLVCHARSAPAVIAQVAAAVLGGAGDLEAANALYAGLPGLFEPLRHDGARALEFGGVALHSGAIEAYRRAGLLA